MTEVAVGQVADFDQKHAEVSASLDVCVAAFREMLNDGEPQYLTIVGQAVYLAQHFEPMALAEHLSVAIARLASDL